MPSLILHFVVRPEGNHGGSGWRMHFSDPSHPIDIQGYTTVLPGGEIVALNPDFRKARGYGIWNTDVSGPYIITLIADDTATLAVDGKIVAEMYPNHPLSQRIDNWIKLKKGPHLFRIEYTKNEGGGGFTVALMIPPKMNRQILAGDNLRAPDIPHLDFWWFLLETAVLGRIPAWILFLVLLLCYLVPRSLDNTPVAVLLTIVLTVGPALFSPSHLDANPLSAT